MIVDQHVSKILRIFPTITLSPSNRFIRVSRVDKHHTKRLLGQFKYCCSVGMCKSVKEEMLWGNWLVSLCAGFTGHEGEHVNSQFYGQ